MSSDKVLYVNPETKDVIATGNVGIGTTNPTLTKVQIHNSLSISSSADPERLFLTAHSIGFNRNTENGNILNSGGHAYQFQHIPNVSSASDFLSFQVFKPNAEYVRAAFAINGDGQLTNGVFPNYAGGTSRVYNTVYQAATNGYICILVDGDYMNGMCLVVGATNTPTTIIWQNGDNINANTKIASGLLPIPVGYYYQSKIVSGIGGTAGYDFERITMTWYPVQ
jgi:hypothetical protein